MATEELENEINKLNDENFISENYYLDSFDDDRTVSKY